MFRLRNLILHLSSILLLMFIAAIPIVFYNSNDQIVFKPIQVFTLMKNFLLGLFTGKSFYYSFGDKTRSLSTDLICYFISSYAYLAVSGIIVIILTFFLGIWFWKNSEKWLTGILTLIGMIPDFIFILLLQLLVVSVYKNTGIRVAKVASASTDDPAILLPLLTFIIIPLGYILRSTIGKTKEVIAEDFILMAISKGLSRKQIYLCHVTSNVIPFLKADIYKVTAIMISNLFIVEYLFNTRGVTTLLFQTQIVFGYQYNVVIICFFATFLLYICVFFTLKLIIIAVERVLT